MPDPIKIYDSADGITHNLQQKILKLDPNYNVKYKKVNLILTEESSSFRKKFNNYYI